DFNITHSPDLDVTEGEMVNITCCVAGAQRLSYSWIKHQPKVKIQISKYSLLLKRTISGNTVVLWSQHKRPVLGSGNSICDGRSSMWFRLPLSQVIVQLSQGKPLRELMQ
uniref:Ig-like domain-containing protein n=1 Tax=Cynoglossus semilaevis TaxID=244447 RepID=A0A3P8WRI2_CYNSE